MPAKKTKEEVEETKEELRENVITLSDGEEVTFVPKLNGKILMMLKSREGFKTTLLINSLVKKEDIDELVLYDAVFIAYRHANPNGMKYEEFQECYDMNIEEAIEIFSMMVSKEGAEKFSQAFKKKTIGKK